MVLKYNIQFVSSDDTFKATVSMNSTTLKTCFTYLGEGDSDMILVESSLPTGYYFKENSLIDYDNAGAFSRYDVSTLFNYSFIASFNTKIIIIFEYSLSENIFKMTLLNYILSFR